MSLNYFGTRSWGRELLNNALRRVLATTVAVEKQKVLHIVSVCL